jgi:hypothetical protein
MRDWFQFVYIGVVSATLIACAMQNANVPPAQLMSELQAGQPMLTCSMAECGLGWMQNQQKAELLEATGQWQELALFVMRIGFMDDLTYYYLGRAAQELGYLQAAERYYRLSERLSVTQDACGARPSNICSGHVFPDELYPYLATVEAQLAGASASPQPSSESPPSPAPKKRLARKMLHSTPATTSTAAGQAPGSGFVVPTPTAGTAASSSGFVEPAPTAASASVSSSQFAVPSPAR